MTGRNAPARRRPAALVAGVLGTALLLTGCGTSAAQDALVGIRPAPVERTESAPLNPEGATQVAARLLAAADAPVAGDAEAAKAARAAVFTGDALTVAEAEAARNPKPATTTELATPRPPTVVAQSAGRAWPRAILAATLDEDTNTQFLHVMVSEKPEQPFRIAASVPMFGGAELPALGAAADGAPLLDVATTEGLALAPEAAVAAYAAALAHPKAKATEAVAVDDPFATGLRRTATAQTKALGSLGTLTQVHTPQLDKAVTFRLADGGAVTFGLVKRTDTIAVRPTAKELVLPAEYAKVTGRTKVSKSVTLDSLQPLIMVVPASGKAEVIGATELLVSGKGQ